MSRLPFRSQIPALLLIAAALLPACAREVSRPPERPTVIERKRGRPDIASSPEAMLERDGIRRLQQALRERGYEVPGNGNYDGQTRRAVLAFQRQQRLAATSMPNLQTLEALGLPAERMYRSLGAAEPR